MNIEHLNLNWFALFAVVLVGIGVFRGRRRGMSEELLDVFKWLLIVFAGGLLYEPVGKLFAQVAGLGLSYAFLVTYLAIVVGVALFFAYLKQAVGEKLVGSDVFGGLEYYLGMVAGAVRYACMVVVFLAVLNSYYITPAQMEAQARMQRENFGSISFPTLGTIQHNVMKKSYTGIFAQKYLKDQLIRPTGRGGSGSNGPARKRERAVDEVIQGM
jgi:uncharacterized membrane protein required for colicin V production